jgi:hypothetical protein
MTMFHQFSGRQWYVGMKAQDADATYLHQRQSTFVHLRFLRFCSLQLLDCGLHFKSFSFLLLNLL